MRKNGFKTKILAILCVVSFISQMISASAYADINQDTDQSAFTYASEETENTDEETDAEISQSETSEKTADTTDQNESPQTDMNQSDSPTDKISLLKADMSNIVDVTKFEIYVDDELVDENHDPLYVGQPVKYFVDWKIEESNFNGKYSTGDTFTIDLPKDYFYFTDTHLNNPLVYEGKTLGTWGIKNNQIVFTLTDEGAQQLSLEGQFEFSGTLSSTGGKDKVEVEIEDEKVIIPTVPETEIPGGEFPYPNPIELDKFYKDGKSAQGSGKIEWFIYTNYDKAYEMAKGILPAAKGNVIVEDILDAGQEVTIVQIYTRLYHPANQTGIPSRYLDNLTISDSRYDYQGFGMKFKYLTQNAGESYEDFTTRLAENIPSYGTYKMDDGRTAVLTNFGNLPEDSPTYEDLVDFTEGDKGLSFKDALKKKYPGLTTEEIDAMVETWGPDNKIAGKIPAFTIKIIAEAEARDEPYKNTATLIQDGGEDEAPAEVKVEDMGGSITGAAPGEVYLFKKDADDDGKLLKGAIFKLQIKNGENWEDYVPKDGGETERTTNTKGFLQFQKLGSGTYQIVEVTPPEGYDGDPGSIGYSPSKEFVMADGDKKGVEITATNKKLKYPFTFMKHDQDNQPLPGANFKLTDENDIEATAISGSDGKVSFTDLLPGKYTLEETDAPDGYTGSDEVWNVEIDLSGNITIKNSEGVPVSGEFIVVNNFINTYELEAKKKVTGTALLTEPQEFTFELKPEAGGTAVAYGKVTVSDKNQEYTIDFYKESTFTTKITDWTQILTNGDTYVLTEDAKAGYTPIYTVDGKTTQKITVEFNTGSKVVVAIENSKNQAPLPSTGGGGTMGFHYFGLALMSAVIIMAFGLRNKKVKSKLKKSMMHLLTFVMAFMSVCAFAPQEVRAESNNQTIYIHKRVYLHPNASMLTETKGVNGVEFTIVDVTDYVSDCIADGMDKEVVVSDLDSFQATDFKGLTVGMQPQKYPGMTVAGVEKTVSGSFQDVDGTTINQDGMIVVDLPKTSNGKDGVYLIMETGSIESISASANMVISFPIINEDTNLEWTGPLHIYPKGEQNLKTGKITINKLVMSGNKDKKVTDTFYFTLFSDKELKNSVITQSVSLKDESSGSTLFTNLVYGTYYVAETDKLGKPVDDKFSYKVRISTPSVTLSDSTTEETVKVINSLDEEIPKTTQPVKTGDNKQIEKYLFALLGSFVIIISAWIYKKKSTR